MNEREKNKALLGTIKLTTGKPYTPKVGHLLRPLPKDATIWIFCTSCAYYIAIGSKSEDLEKKFDIKFPENPIMKEFFLQSPTCHYCKSATEGKKVELKKIADLAKATQKE